MTTSTVAANGPIVRGDSERRGAVGGRPLRRFGLCMAGIVAALVSAWGGIVPYVGPLFGFSGDGSGSWHWNLAHGVLALLPGIAGVLLGLFVVAEARGGVRVGRGRLTLATAGMLLMVCGAWFAIGPLAWPVLSDGGAYFAAGSHLRMLAYEVGYSIGTGIVLVVCGAFVDGWASRHQRNGRIVRASVGSSSVPTEAEPMTGRVESGI
jgi:hypothetical protein